MSPAVNDTVTLWGDQSQLQSNSYNSLDYNIQYVLLYCIVFCIFYCPVLNKTDFKMYRFIYKCENTVYVLYTM